MADEETNQTDEHGQADEVDESAEQDTPTELPDDPAERATALEAQLAAERKVTSRLQKQNETLEESRRETESGQKTWYRKFAEVEAELAEIKGKRKAKEPDVDDEDQKFWLDEKGKPKELADFVAEGVTVQQLFKRAGVVTRAELDKQLDERVRRETEKAGTYRRLTDPVTGYPDMVDQNSPLMKAALDEYTVLERERPDVDDATRWELAAARAARKINYVPGKAKTNGKTDDESERERRRNGHGGPTGKSIGSKGAVTITPELRAMAKKMNGGVAVDDKVILAQLKRQQADRAALSQRA